MGNPGAFPLKERYAKTVTDEKGMLKLRFPVLGSSAGVYGCGGQAPGGLRLIPRLVSLVVSF
jgi:hypothetical protein